MCGGRKGSRKTVKQQNESAPTPVVGAIGRTVATFIDVALNVNLLFSSFAVMAEGMGEVVFGSIPPLADRLRPRLWLLGSFALWLLWRLWRKKLRRIPKKPDA